MTVKLVIACGAFAMASILAATPAAAAVAFTLNNTGGGDGFVIGDSTNFDLFGSNNETGGNITGYTGLATATQGYKATYTYTTHDVAGTFYDPAGYYINGAFKQLSPVDAPNGTSVSGVLRFRVHAGDTYGFYVASDGEFGRANIAATIATDVPEPATWVMLVAGFGIVGTTLRRRNGATQLAAA